MAPSGERGFRYVGHLPSALLIAVIASLALATSPASAKLVYTPSSTFAGTGTNALSAPTGIAVDNSSGPSAGAVYVTDTANRRVEKFDASGNFLLMFGKGVNQTTSGDVCPVNPGDVCQAGSSGSAAGQFDTPTFVAVDPSSGPSAGDVYVGDTSTGIVQKFDPSGNLITGWGGTPAGGQLNGFGNIAGVAVDVNGTLLVINTSSTLHKRAQDGTSPSSFDVVRGTDPNGLAVDPTGAYFYKANGDVQSYEKISSANGDVGAVNNVGTQKGVAVDPATGDMFASSGTSIDRFHFTDVNKVETGGVQCTFGSFSGCGSTESFGSAPTLNGATGLAVSASNGRVYVANTGSHNVVVFAYLILADIVPGPDTDVTPTSVTVNAEVDPAGGPDITGCKVEYGTAANTYGLGEIACSPSPSGTPFSSPTAVAATVANMTVLVPYHYRFAVTTVNGTSYSPDLSVTAIPNLPAVERTFASGVSAGGATLNADVDPGFGLTVYRFDYGPSDAYGSRTLVGGPIDPQSSDHTASAVLSELTPGTTYHFRALVTNFAGTVYGPDRTFTTPSAPSILASSAEAITQTSARLSALLNPGLRLTTYRFEYGTSEAYGSSTPAGGPIGPDDAIHSVPATLDGLAPGTTYHYRIVAGNEIGTALGPDRTFTTQSTPPSSGGGTKAKCRRGFVRKHGKCVKKKHRKHRRTGHGHG